MRDLHWHEARGRLQVLGVVLFGGGGETDILGEIWAKIYTFLSATSLGCLGECLVCWARNYVSANCFFFPTWSCSLYLLCSSNLVGRHSCIFRLRWLSVQCIKDHQFWHVLLKATRKNTSNCGSSVCYYKQRYRNNSELYCMEQSLVKVCHW